MPDEDEPLPEFSPQSHVIEYELTGSYTSCDVTYLREQGTTEAKQDVAPPWDESVKINIDRPTEVHLKATCRAPDREGKSQLSISVDGDVVDRAATTGYGATAEATYTIGESDSL